MVFVLQNDQRHLNPEHHLPTQSPVVTGISTKGHLHTDPHRRRAGLARTGSTPAGAASGASGLGIPGAREPSDSLGQSSLRAAADLAGRES